MVQQIVQIGMDETIVNGWDEGVSLPFIPSIHFGWYNACYSG